MFQVRREAIAVIAAAGALAVLLSTEPAHAADVDELIAILKSKPSGMKEDAWREKRRGAARELGFAGDPRAVPALIAVIESERLDDVVEIAIEALGRIGDRRAADALAKIYRDESRTKFTRGEAARALRALGVDPDSGAASGPSPADAARMSVPADGKEDAVVITGGKPAGSSGGGITAVTGPGDEADPDKDVTIPAGPVLPGDALAASERLTLGVGSLAASYDSTTKRAVASGDAASRYRRGLELPGIGFSIDAGLALTAAVHDRDTDNPETGSQAVVGQALSAGEARFYPFSPAGAFGHLDAAIGFAGSAVKITDPMAATLEDFAPSAALSLGLGPGFGRVIDIGVRLRLRRIEQSLKQANALARPIDGELARKLYAAWWALRGEFGVRRRLLVTIKMLRDAGVMVSDPDPGTTYRLLRVLEDGQLAERIDGFEVRVGVGESFVMQDTAPMADDVEWNRVETALLRATVGYQIAEGLAEIVGEARGTYRITGSPGFYTGDATLTARRYFYGYGWDPRGAIELGVQGGISDLDTDEPMGQPKIGPGTRFGALLGYLYMPNRASRLRVAAEAALEGKQLFLGLRAQGTFALLDATAAGW